MQLLPRLPGQAFGRSLGPAALAVGLCIATMALIWLSYQATAQSRQSSDQLLQRRVREQVGLLWAGVTQDMKGAHTSVLVPISLAPPEVDPAYDLAEAFARGFARFPYPESFFVWRDTGVEGGLEYVFNRVDRRPPWDDVQEPADPYPVVILRNPAAARVFVDEARRLAGYGRPAGVFDLEVAGARYQVVVSFQYRTDDPNRLTGLVGFTVRLDWVREHYFSELTLQIDRIGNFPNDVSLAVLDDTGRSVASTRPASDRFEPVERSFPLLFIDRAVLGPFPREYVSRGTWAASASVASGSSLAASAAGFDQLFVMTSLSAVALVMGLLLTWRGARVAADVAQMKSDFVSSVTHDLKTPLSVIRLLADTLAAERYESRKSARHYAQQLSRESRNLSALIDHLLAYARVTDDRNAYTFDLVEVGELIDEAMDRFQTLLVEKQFTVVVDLAPDLPAVRGDRSALVQALDALLDNAIKYSDDVESLHIKAQASCAQLIISIADRGVGIHEDDIVNVFDRFFRGRNVAEGGSGLGLTIAKRIIEDHDGRLSIHSFRGEGTRVEVILPVVST